MMMMMMAGMASLLSTVSRPCTLASEQISPVDRGGTSTSTVHGPADPVQSSDAYRYGSCIIHMARAEAIELERRPPLPGARPWVVHG